MSLIILHLALYVGKWLKRNISVITPKGEWMMYPEAEHDIVITYRGVNAKGKAVWGSSEVTATVRRTGT